VSNTIEALKQGKNIRVMGFDDAPFSKERNSIVNISGIVCSLTRFEGMVWGEVKKDGDDATSQLIDLITKSKFYPQLHAILLDGIAFGGFNIIDLQALSTETQLPCIAVMRKCPNLAAIDKALTNFTDYERRSILLKNAGTIQQQGGFIFQHAGIDRDNAACLLGRVTDTGKVPEPLRLAHFIGAAVKTGESSNRA